MPTYNERVLDELHKIKSGVSSMCIDTGAGEICTSSIGTGSTVTIYADGGVQAGCRRFRSVQEMVNYVSNRPEEWEGETSEEGLEEWAVKATAFAHYAAEYLGLTLPEEKGSPLVNNDKYGPQTAEVEALFERANTLTVNEVSALRSAQGVAQGVAQGTAWGVAWNVAWSAARNAAWNDARNAARGTAWNAARNAAWNAAVDAAWGTAWSTAQGVARDAARNAAGALVVRDLIGQHGFTQEHYNLLTHVWAAVIGPVHPDDAPIATHPTLTPEATEAPATQTDNNTVFTITGPMSMTYENGVATIVGGSLSINPAI